MPHHSLLPITRVFSDPKNLWLLSGLGMLFGLCVIFFALIIRGPQKTEEDGPYYGRMVFWTIVGIIVFGIFYVSLITNRLTM